MAGTVGGGETSPTVLVPGTFDRFHRGHEALLRRASGFGVVHVALSTDSFAESYKRKPRDHFTLRLVRLLESGLVSGVLARSEYSMTRILDKVQPDFWVTGHDWMGDRHFHLIGETREQLTERGLTMCYVPRTQGVSTSEILDG